VELDPADFENLEGNVFHFGRIEIPEDIHEVKTTNVKKRVKSNFT
jgi:hypothetical protein